MRIWLNGESGFRPSREAQRPYLRKSLSGDGLLPSAPGRSPRRAVREAGLRSDDSQCSPVFQMWRRAPVASSPVCVIRILARLKATSQIQARLRLAYIVAEVSDNKQVKLVYTRQG